jgi:uncharacterized membrane protein YraQ (UPF0718 family)
MAKDCCAHAPARPFYRKKTFITAAAVSLPVFLSYFIPLLEPFRTVLFGYVRTIWWAILLGLLIGGAVDHYVPREYISHILARKKKRTIFYAVFLGFLTSACSHGIIALSMELHKKGASNPAVVAFLLASPWANLTLTVMLIGFFGLKALYIIFSAIFIALVTGFVYQALERRGAIEKNDNTVDVGEDFKLFADIKKRITGRRMTAGILLADLKGVIAGAVSLGDMVLWWILIGIGISSAAGAYVPAHVFQQYMGPTVLGLLVTLGLATVIEVCSEGSAPMAFEIFRQTGALGNSFVFLMAGVVTDYTEIGMLWHNVGRRTAIWLPIVTVPQVVLLGIIANKIF